MKRFVLGSLACALLLRDVSATDGSGGSTSTDTATGTPVPSLSQDVQTYLNGLTGTDKKAAVIEASAGLINEVQSITAPTNASDITKQIVQSSIAAAVATIEEVTISTLDSLNSQAASSN